MAILPAILLAPVMGCADPLIIPPSCVNRNDPNFPTYFCYKVFRHFREILDMANSDTIADLNLDQLRQLLAGEATPLAAEDGADAEIRRLQSQIKDQSTKIERLEALLSAALAQTER